jgi:plastocyanin
MIRMKWIAIVVASVALLSVSACGGSAAQPAGSTKVDMTEFKFDPGDLTVQHGKVVFWLVNAGSTQHDLAIRDASGSTIATSELVSAGDSKEFDVDNLAAGKYTIVCTQQGHEASGMKGTLTVT